MLTINLFMFVFEKNDDHLAAMESYKDLITKKKSSFLKMVSMSTTMLFTAISQIQLLF